jgi:hypothetical protein
MKKAKHMKLTELLHAIDEEAKEGLVSIEDWRWPDVDHLHTMGFVFMDDHHMQTEKPPKMVIYKKKSLDEASGKQTSHFYIEEPKRAAKRFKTFNDVIDFFDNYRQPELEKNM